MALGIIPKISEFLGRSKHYRLVFESMWILCNISASSQSGAVACIIKSGSVKMILELISDPKNAENCKDLAILAIGNIAGDSLPAREYLLQQNSLDILLKSYGSCTKNGRQSIIWTLVNLCGRQKSMPSAVRH